MRWWGFRPVGGESGPGFGGAPQPDSAWKVLDITNESIRHADTKAGVTLAFVGATATALFDLVDRIARWRWPVVVVAVLASAAIVTAACCAALVLLPRLGTNRAGTANDADPAANLLFFADIHRRYGDDRPTYRDVLSLLTTDPLKLTEQIADQIHANAHIALIKFRHANRAIAVELVALASVAVVALLRTIGW